MWTVTVTLLTDTGLQINTVNKCFVDSEALGIGGFNTNDTLLRYLLQHAALQIKICVCVCVCIAPLTRGKTRSLSTFHSVNLLLYKTPFTRHYKDIIVGFDTSSRITDTFHV